MREMARSIGLFVLACTLVSLGCHISDYPIITDDRGDYSGVIRTGHKAYIQPTGTTATIWSDGSEETFTMVYQNQYGDQKLYSFTNYDPTASVIYLDQTYCDWQYEGCPPATSWNPVQNDDPFDLVPAADGYFYDNNCSGARSLCVWVAMSMRIGECGDAAFRADPQAFYREFSMLEETTWRGERAYLLPIDSGTTDITLVAMDGSRWSIPHFGGVNAIVTDRLEAAFPMTPNTRHIIRWAREWTEAHGQRATAEVTYGGIDASVELALEPSALAFNEGRY